MSLVRQSAPTSVSPRPAYRAGYHETRFATVMSPAVTPARRHTGAGVTSFIEACDCAIDSWFTRADEDPLPDLEVEDPRAMVKAFLLWAATAGVDLNGEASENMELICTWHGRVAADVWETLGFASAPNVLTTTLAFAALLADCGREATEHLWPVFVLVADLASSDQLSGVFV